MLKFDFDEAGRTLTCRFSGQLDTAKCAEMEKDLFNKIGEVSKTGGDLRLVFDLGEVEFVTSAFLRLCLKAAKKVKENDFAVVNQSPYVKKIFKIAGFDRTFNIS